MYPISVHIRECRQNADHCAQNAQNQSDPKARQSYLEMQRRWLGLASSYEFSEYLEFMSSIQTKNEDARSILGAHG